MTEDAAAIKVEFAAWDTLKKNLMPTLVIDSKCLLAEPVTESTDDSDISERWHHDFYMQEDQLLQGSVGSSCVTKYLFIVSSMCHRNIHLDVVSDDMLRTVMLHLLEEEDDLNEQSLPGRFIDLFVSVECYLLDSTLSYCFLPSVNPISCLQPSITDELNHYVSGVIGMNRFRELLKTLTNCNNSV